MKTNPPKEFTNSQFIIYIVVTVFSTAFLMAGVGYLALFLAR